MNGSNVILILTAAFLVFGIVFTGIGFAIRSSTAKKQENCTVQTVAVVSEMKREVNLSSGGDSYRSWFPTFTYTAGGTEISVKSKIGNQKKILEEGQRVALFYNPSNPREYYVAEENVSSVSTIFMIVGIALAAMGVLCLILKLFVVRS